MNPNTNPVDCRTLRTHMYFHRFSPLEEKVTQFRVERSDDQRSGARFSKVPIINGPGKLSPFTLKIEVSIGLHLT